MEQKDTNTGANANANANLPYGAQDPEAVSKKDKALIVTILIILLIIAGLAVIGFLCIKPQPDTEIRISGKLPGRVHDIYVQEGQHVHAGDTLVHIVSSLVDAQYDQAEAMEQAAQAANAKVDAGTRVQIIQSAEDVWKQALTAPFDGEVTVIYPNVSELVATGAPIMTIQKDDHWAVFNVRETLLKDITLGSKIKVRIPALDKDTVMDVFYIKDLGTYANWQATKATGDYDARTFQIKARPASPVKNFRPGMSVIYLGVEKK